MTTADDAARAEAEAWAWAGRANASTPTLVTALVEAHRAGSAWQREQAVAVSRDQGLEDIAGALLRQYARTIATLTEPYGWVRNPEQREEMGG
ncbi:MAG: hypothetical protein ACO1ON_12920 [Nocardioides sp.]